VIAVAAVDQNKNIPEWSSSGRQVEISAPGDQIYSTFPWGYGYFSGTSMATPHVSAAAALLKAFNPSLTNEQIRNAIDATAEDLGYSSKDQGKGLLRVDLAFKCVQENLKCLEDSKKPSKPRGKPF